jgi:quinolinate synthase
MPYQTPIAQEYLQAAPEELARRVTIRKEQLGESLCILGHHYQRDEIIRFADFTGDSLRLSQQAARLSTARTIVFCGVHFMAESADVLAGDEQVVCLPHMLAGCAMAEMAETDAVESALADVSARCASRVIPVTYVNSTAAIKALTARAGGACCTSSNVRNVFEWALRTESDSGAGGEKVFAIPDQHLGRNTAMALGYGADDVVVYDPQREGGGLSAEDLARATFILWKGCCYVHQRFRPEHVASVRAEHPGIRVVVHPECPREVVQEADASGSTEQMIREVADGTPGSQWAIGTESNLVNRLARKHPDRLVRVLSDSPALCTQMGRIDLAHLLWVLDNAAEGRIVNQVTVPEDLAVDARIALERMIAIRAVGGTTPSC